MSAIPEPARERAAAHERPSAAHTISRWARFRLAVMAISGVAFYHLVLVAPFALLMICNPWTGYYGVWPIVGVITFFWWTLQPYHETPGLCVARAQAPALFEIVEALADRIGAPRIDEIRLTDDYNAGALEAPVRWQPWRKRQVLLLGVPLLALNDAGSVCGFIAHELGHFSHRHGRLGQWIYRARAGWLSYAGAPFASVSLLERGAAFFAHWFAPRFSKLSFDYSRQCEYEADAYGAAVVGRVAMASGLLTLMAYGQRWQDMAEKELPRLIALQDAPPPAWMAQVQQRVLTRPAQADDLERLRAKASDPHDTHPTLAERMQALSVSGDEALRACDLPQQVAGAAWLLDWDAVVGRLDMLRGANDLTLARARLELEYGEPETVMDIARRWLDDRSLGSDARFLLGAAQLKRGDKDGIGTLEACIKSDPLWALAARDLIEQHAALLDTEAQRDRNRRLLRRARIKRGRALGSVLDKLQRGELAPATLDEDSWGILREVFSAAPVIAAAWCGGIDELVHEQRRYRTVVLVLRLRTERLQELNLSEDEVRSEARSLLGALLPGSTLRLVWTVYTTEPLAPELDARLGEWARTGERCCLVSPREGESVGPGARAAALR